MHLSSTVPTLSFTDTNSFTDANDRFIVRASTNRGNIQWYDDSASTTTELMTFLPAGNVGIGTSSPATPFHAKRDNDNQLTATIENNGSATTGRHVLKLISSGTGSGTKLLELQSAGGSTTRFEVLADGRGLSQFTAKAWVNYNGVASSINDSHNVI